MSILVCTPTGNVGSVVVDRLLTAGENVVLYARNPSKLAGYVSRGAKVVQGTLEDRETLLKASEGAEAMLWVTPPNFVAEDMRAYQNRLGENAAYVVRTNSIPYVVNLSSIGAHLPGGTGPIAGLHDVEALLNSHGKNIVHLRAGVFFENTLMNRTTIDAHGAIYMPCPGTTRLPQIATRDIGEAAATLLLSRDWKGRMIQGLHGPADLSYDEVAATISEVLQKPVKHVQVAPEQSVEAMIGMGASRNVATVYVEMMVNAGRGMWKPAEPRTAATTTRTSLAEWAVKAFGIVR